MNTPLGEHRREREARSPVGEVQDPAVAVGGTASGLPWWDVKTHFEIEGPQFRFGARTLSGPVLQSLEFILVAKRRRRDKSYALRATAEVSAKEACANLETLRKNLRKQAEGRRWKS